MSKTQTFAQAVMNTARGTALAAWTPYLALYIGDPEAGGAEVIGGSYARQLIVWAAPTGNRMVNSNLVQFPAPTGSWGLLTHSAIVDAISGGTRRQTYQLQGTDTQRTVIVGVTPPNFAPGTIIWTET